MSRVAVPQLSRRRIVLRVEERGKVTARSRVIKEPIQIAHQPRQIRDPIHRLPNNASFCFPDTSGEAMLLELERHGVLCSSGSACAAGSDEPSHVLVALGIKPEVARTAVRFTLSRGVDQQQIEAAVQAVAASHAALRSLASH